MKHSSSSLIRSIASASSTTRSTGSMASCSFDVLEDPKRLDGLLPNRRSALERRRSFLQKSNSFKRTATTFWSSSSSSSSLMSSSSLYPSGGSGSLAFAFCESENDDDSDIEQEQEATTTTETLRSSAVKTDPLVSAPEGNVIPPTRQESLSSVVGRGGSVLMTNTRRRQVQFSTVTVHYHETILGDNFFVSSGAPLALGWQRVGPAETTAVDDFERLQKNTRRAPKLASASPHHLKLSPGMRQRRLQQAGVKYVDLVRRMEQCDTLRFQQQESIRRAAATAAKKKAPAPKPTPTRPRVVKVLQRLFLRRG